MKTCVIVPVYCAHQDLDANELISLKSLEKLKLTKIQISPSEVEKFSIVDELETFDKSYFKDRDSYSKLLLSKKFYERFLNYDYVLIFQLDCIVAGDCDQLNNLSKFSYTGAPIKRHKRWIVGNGGLSYRNVADHLNVLNGKRPSLFRCLFLKDIGEEIKSINPLKILLKKLNIYFEIKKLGVHQYISNYSLNEDLFWCFRATLFSRDYHKAPLKNAALFAIETDVDYWLGRIKGMPFGFHAWPKFLPTSVINFMQIE